MYMDLNATEGELAALLPVVSISKQTSQTLKKAAASGAAVAVWLPQYSSFDFNAILLWIIAVGTFLLAGVWAGNDSYASEDSYLKSPHDAEVSTCLCITAATPLKILHVSAMLGVCDTKS